MSRFEIVLIIMGVSIVLFLALWLLLDRIAYNVKIKKQQKKDEESDE